MPPAWCSPRRSPGAGRRRSRRGGPTTTASRTPARRPCGPRPRTRAIPWPGSRAGPQGGSRSSVGLRAGRSWSPVMVPWLRPAPASAYVTSASSRRDYDPGMPDERDESEGWRRLLTGEDPTLLRVRRLWQHVPNGPRCKVCASPFHGVGGAFARVMWHGPIANNPLLCKACFGQLSSHQGGAELEISVLFADVRGSTGLAERVSAAAFRGLLQGYYKTASSAIDASGGIIDKFLGDGVMALFVPVLTGENHAGRAIAAGRA